ncbi:MAG: hypothetical protein U0359_14345 [Byssovorax sp.]
MSIELARRLISAGIVAPDEVEAALFLSVVRGVPLCRVLIDRGAVSERVLEDELERLGGLGLRQVVGASDLVARLPKAMCRRLAALPTRVDAITGIVDVAAADPLDPHVAAEMGFHLGVPIRVLRAPIAAIEEALRRLELEEQRVPRGRSRRVTPPFPHGAPQSSVPPPPTDEAPILLVRKRTSGSPEMPEGPEVDHEELAAAEEPVALETPRTGKGGRTPLLPAELPSVSFPSEPPPENEPSSLPGLAITPPIPGAILLSKPPADEEAPIALYPKRAPTPPYGTPVFVPPANEGPAMPFSERPSMKRTARPPLMADMESEAESKPPLERALAPTPLPVMPPVEEAVDAEEDAPEPAPPEPAEPPPSPPLVRAPDGTAVLDALAAVRNRDEVIRLTLRGMRLVGRRLGVFAVKRDGFHGWACNVELGDPGAFREVMIPAELPSVLATATATSFYLGPIPPTPAHERLLALMETASADVAVLAVRVAGRPALVLLADDLDDTLTGTRFLDELGRAVGDALSRLLASRQ